MSRLMDAWNQAPVEKPIIEIEQEPAKPEEPIEDEAVSQKKTGRPSATLDRSKKIKTTSIKITEDDLVYCSTLAKELHEDGLCGGDISSVLAYLIKKSKEEYPEVAEAANAIYKLQSKRILKRKSNSEE